MIPLSPDLMAACGTPDPYAHVRSDKGRAGFERLFADARLGLTDAPDPNEIQAALLDSAHRVGAGEHEQIIDHLSNGDERVRSVMMQAWCLAKVGIRNPMTEVEKLDLAAEILAAWAQAKGYAGTAALYKKTAQNLAQLRFGE